MSGGTPRASASELGIAEAFALMDVNGDGALSRIEVIKACRQHERIRRLLGLPRTIRQEDGSRDEFERLFQRLDSDASKAITLREMLDFFAPAGGGTPGKAPVRPSEVHASRASSHRSSGGRGRHACASHVPSHAPSPATATPTGDEL